MALDMAAVLPLRRASTIRNLRTEDSSEVVLSVVLSAVLSARAAEEFELEPGTVFDRDKDEVLVAPGSRDGKRLRDILELWFLADWCLAGDEPRARGEARLET